MAVWSATFPVSRQLFDGFFDVKDIVAITSDHSNGSNNTVSP
jgi:hypothetical protein